MRLNYQFWYQNNFELTVLKNYTFWQPFHNTGPIFRFGRCLKQWNWQHGNFFYRFSKQNRGNSSAGRFNSYIRKRCSFEVFCIEISGKTTIYVSGWSSKSQVCLWYLNTEIEKAKDSLKEPFRKKKLTSSV